MLQWYWYANFLRYVPQYLTRIDNYGQHQNFHTDYPHQPVFVQPRQYNPLVYPTNYPPYNCQQIPYLNVSPQFGYNNHCGNYPMNSNALQGGPQQIHHINNNPIPGHYTHMLNDVTNNTNHNQLIFDSCGNIWHSILNWQTVFIRVNYVQTGNFWIRLHKWMVMLISIVSMENFPPTPFQLPMATGHWIKPFHPMGVRNRKYFINAIFNLIIQIWINITIHIRTNQIIPILINIIH